MSHEITDTDKVFTVGEQAWHGLDDNRKGPRLTAEEAKAYLNWRVKKVPATYEGKPVDGAFYTVREDTDAVLGVVGSQYSVIQNHWLFKLLEPVVDQGACIYETGGSLWWTQGLVRRHFQPACAPSTREQQAIALSLRVRHVVLFEPGRLAANRRRLCQGQLLYGLFTLLRFERFLHAAAKVKVIEEPQRRNVAADGQRINGWSRCLIRLSDVYLLPHFSNVTAAVMPQRKRGSLSNTLIFTG